MTCATDDVGNRRQFESWWSETMNTTVMDLHRFRNGYACHETNRGWMAWNACRATMLQDEPVTTTNKLGNSPVIPDTWIPVSERVPEEGGRYWCYVEEQNSLGKSHYQWNCSWNGDEWSEKELTGRVTHWRPLPAAPQEEKP